MAADSRPEHGLVLLPTRDPSPTPAPAHQPQVMRLTLAQKAAEELFKTFQNKEKVSIRFGHRIFLQHGRKSQPVFCTPESNPSELYRQSTDDLDTFYFSGNLSHRLETQRAQKDTAKADEALANLESSLKTYQAQKASNEARFVTNRDEIRHLTEIIQKGRSLAPQSSTSRKDRLLGRPNRSNPASPFLAANSSPALGPTPAPRPVSASMNKDQIRLSAVRIPFLHLLAVGPVTPRTLRERLHAAEEDCQSLLQKYTRNTHEESGRQELKDKAYRELDLWRFPYPQAADRQAAVDRSISAFDRMRINTNDPIWENLVPLDERGRGRGSELSRLKIGQAGINGMTPKPVSTKADPGGKVVSETDVKKSAYQASGSSTMVQAPKSTNDKRQGSKGSSREAATKPSKATPGKVAIKNEKKKAQSNSKFKSSAVIEDSDEELDSVKSFREETAPPEGSRSKAGSTNPKHPANIATSSNRPPETSSTTKAKANDSLMPDAAVARARSDTATNKVSSRLRADSSPQKSSPLASSPPTNATDLRNLHSSKASSGLSSNTASSAVNPLRDHRDARQAISEPQMSTTTLKRKAGDQASSAVKRQQQPNGTHIPRIVENGVTKSTSDRHTNSINPLAPSQPRRSRIPSSSSSSSVSVFTASTTSTTARTSSPSSPTPEPSTQHDPNANNTPSTTATMIDHWRSELQLKSRRFKTLYERYHRLHAKVMNTNERHRDVAEIKDLTKMRDRIARLKAEIWTQWAQDRIGSG